MHTSFIRPTVSKRLASHPSYFWEIPSRSHGWEQVGELRAHGQMVYLQFWIRFGILSTLPAATTWPVLTSRMVVVGSDSRVCSLSSCDQRRSGSIQQACHAFAVQFPGLNEVLPIPDTASPPQIGRWRAHACCRCDDQCDIHHDDRYQQHRQRSLAWAHRGRGSSCCKLHPRTYKRKAAVAWAATSRRRKPEAA